MICGRLGELLKEAASGSECDVVAAFPFIYFIFFSISSTAGQTMGSASEWAAASSWGESAVKRWPEVKEAAVR